MKDCFFQLFREICSEAEYEKLYAKIIKAYTKPKRHYHTLEGHIGFCLEEFSKFPKTSLQNPLAVGLALVFHDIVMNFKRNDNEERSAEFARKVLSKCTAPSELIELVEALILYTKHGAVPLSADYAAVIDIDLMILGQNQEIFDRYEEGIRAEYAFVPEARFRVVRIGILEEFLARPHIYTFPHIREAYEEKARENIVRSLKKLRVT